MALILTIETSTPTGSAALFSNETLLAAGELYLDKSHSRAILPLANHLLQMAEATPANLAAVAVSTGPGSYTGLRIGLGVAKGICTALGIPLISVSSLKTLAWGVINLLPPNSLICPMIDARRMEVYAAIYTTTGAELLQPSPEIITENSFANTRNQNPNATLYLLGNGSDKCMPTAQQHWQPVSHLVGCHPLAKNMGTIAYQKYQNKKFENIVDFQPHYLKEFMLSKPKGA